MNYALTYSKLITRAQKRDVVSGYVERHHIFPKALGGSNDKSNLVNLTAREHFIAHFLLAKMYGGSMWNAITIMKKDGRYNSKLFEIARKKISKQMIGNQITLGRKISLEESVYLSSIRKGKKGRTQSDLTKKKLSAINKGKILSVETKAKISISQKGLKKPEGHGLKVSAFLTGKQRSEDTKRKVSESLKKFYAARRIEKSFVNAESSPHATHGDKNWVVSNNALSQSVVLKNNPLFN